MPFQHEGIDAFLFVSKRAERDGTGDVGGAVEILSAAVEQQEAFRFQRHISLWSSLIMYDSTMFLIASNSIKGETTIEGLLRAETLKFLRDREFCEWRVCCHFSVKPIKEFCHCDAVAQHRRPKTRYFPFILYRLHPLDRRLILNDFRLGKAILTSLVPYHFIESVVYLIWVEQDIVLKVSLQAILYLFVVLHFEILRLQIGHNLRR